MVNSIKTHLEEPSSADGNDSDFRGKLLLIYKTLDQMSVLECFFLFSVQVPKCALGIFLAGVLEQENRK